MADDTLEPPPQPVDDVNSWEWRNWFARCGGFAGRYLNPEFLAPVSINQTDGGAITGTVTDIQAFNDGNEINIVEASGAPGFRLEINFTNVGEIVGIICYTRYIGSSTHEVSLQLRDYTNSTDLDLLRIAHTPTIYQYRTVLLPTDTDFIDPDNNAQIIIDHVSSGTPNHNIYISYVALLGRRRDNNA